MTIRVTEIIQAKGITIKAEVIIEDHPIKINEFSRKDILILLTIQKSMIVGDQNQIIKETRPQGNTWFCKTEKLS